MDTLHPISIRIRRPGLLAVGLIFLLQVMAWAWIPASAMTGAAEETSGIVICTGDGLVTLLPDGTKVPLEDKATKTPYRCPLCLLVSALTTPSAITVASLHHDRVLYALRPLPADQTTPSCFQSPRKARAPPRL